ncbi:Beta-glucosidase 30 [Frankliniella fusca]|uniref:Beta-glucosidase 30 n=1 Tax=Frankliniella fusca TaxID=407009 RepID=A0AAE1LMN2_9NEOP|nr:Beta-glucosidase 30 [Frankliniella fusca]
MPPLWVAHGTGEAEGDAYSATLSPSAPFTVTMLHYDQPATLELSTGGFGYPLIIDKYVEFANFLFETFGDKVKYWNTFNEPNLYCNYFKTLKPTGNNDDDQFYQCVHNIALAHMKTYQLYKQKYQEKQKGTHNLVTKTSAL